MQVRGASMQRGMHRFVKNLDLACDGVCPANNNNVDAWMSDGLRDFAAKTIFDALFNSIFGRQSEDKDFRSVPTAGRLV